MFSASDVRKKAQKKDYSKTVLGICAVSFVYEVGDFIRYFVSFCLRMCIKCAPHFGDCMSEIQTFGNKHSCVGNLNRTGFCGHWGEWQWSVVHATLPA